MLGMTPDVMGAKYVFTHPYIIRLKSELERSYPGKVQRRMMWYTYSSKIGSGWALESLGVPQEHALQNGSTALCYIGLCLEGS